MASGSFSLAFSTDFEVYSGVLPSGHLSTSLLGYYWLNDFNKTQEIYIWNR